MKNLRFERMELLSLSEEKGRTFKFHPRLTVITGPNDVGKSSLIKSLYWAFGAVPRSIHRKWREANIKAKVDFTIDGIAYSIVRSKDTYGVFSGGGILLFSTSAVTSELGPFIASLLDFGLVLSNRDRQPEIPPPAFAFLPFYVNQEGGWERPFNSFDYLGQYQDWRRSVVDYHSGILGNDYYRAAADKRQIANDREELQRDRKAVAKAVEKLRMQVEVSGLELSIQGHEDSVENLLSRLKRLREARLKRAADLADVLDRRQLLDSQIAIVKKAADELRDDAKFAANLEVEQVMCPTCGTMHQNDFSTRFGILDDREACYEFLSDGWEKLHKLSDDAKKAEVELRQTDASIAEIEAILDIRRNDVTLREVIDTAGRQTAAKVFDEQIGELDQQIGELLAEERMLDELLAELKDPKRRATIEQFYAVLMLGYLKTLDVSNIDHDEAAKLDGRIVETGSDQPRAVLAYFMAFARTVQEFSSSFLAPLVLDSPNQQDQDPVNVRAMIDLIISERPSDTQVILGTVSMHGVTVDDGETIELTEKLSLLREADYASVLLSMRPYLEQMVR
ncbi:hypothetical protein [Rhizobium leguminosarum]|uniref:hypothetical protein n=1 Tax=Rhizobium leguminosarum TaxID=384 RepID=UPI003F943545